MAFKSVIDIDVNDEKFQSFLSSFDDFLGKTKEVPEPFKDISDQIEKARTHISKLGADIDKRMGLAGKTTKGLSGEFQQAGKHMGVLSRGIDRGTTALKKFGEAGKRSFAYIGKISETFAKAIPFLGAFAAAGAAAAFAGVALYGRESKNITDRYKNAKALGMKPGTVSALETAYSPYLANSQQTVGQFGSAYMSFTGRNALQRVIGPQALTLSKHAAFQEAIEKAQAFAKSHATESFDAMDKAMGFAQLGISAADLRILKNTSAASIASAQRNVSTERNVLNFSKTTGRNMERMQVTIAQAQIQLSTDLGRTLSKGAPAVRDALNKLVAVINRGVNQLNLVLSGKESAGRAAVNDLPKGWVRNAANYLLGPKTALGKAKLALEGAKGNMIRAEGTSRYAAEKAAYEKALAAYQTLKTATPWYERIHNPMDIEKFKGDASYLNKGNGIRYAMFKSNAADYRQAARIIRGYKADTVAGIAAEYSGAKGAALAQYLKNVEAGSLMKGSQVINKNNPIEMANLLTGIRIAEQPTGGKTPTQIYNAILAALEHVKIHVHVHTPGPSVAGRTYTQTHTAARG